MIRHIREALVEWIEARKGRVTTKQLQQSNSRRYPTSNTARLALQNLVDDGMGRWEKHSAAPNGGRPTEDFVLIAPPPVDTGITYESCAFDFC